jgi:hypothetical protein
MKTARGRKPKRQTSRRPIPTNVRAHERSQAGVGLTDWRADSRIPVLRKLARRLDGLKWTRALFLLLLDELYVSDEFDEILGTPENIPPARYPQAVAMAIALRHGWRPDDLHGVVKALAGGPSRTA